MASIWQLSGSLVAHYPLNDSVITYNKIYDCSGNGHHGFCTDASRPLIISGSSPRYLRCVEFDTTAKYVEITGLPVVGDIYTFSWWGWWTETAGNYMFWGYRNGNRLNMFRATEQLFWNTGDSYKNPFESGAQTVPAVGLGTWAHYVIASDGTTDKLYVNGELYATAKTHVAITGTTLILNGWDTGTGYKVAGTKLSDFRLYSTTLTVDQVKELYNNPITLYRNGKLSCFEVYEADDQGVEYRKTGVVTATDFEENSEALGVSKFGEVSIDNIVEC